MEGVSPVKAEEKILERKTHQSVVQRSGQMLEVQPHIESRLRRDRNLQPKPFEALQHVVALMLEMPLECNLLLVRVHRIKERDSRKLQGMVRAAVKERSGLREGSNEVFRSNDPADTPAWETPVLITNVQMRE